MTVSALTLVECLIGALYRGSSSPQQTSRAVALNCMGVASAMLLQCEIRSGERETLMHSTAGRREGGLGLL
jgi:hypothetical protein